ncbi:MAG: hypothetical protein GXP55_25190 [Deltaproteobacteria bacterium]|nr:hypothetical protein [Deltaproteobacteria bacterium]
MVPPEKILELADACAVAVENTVGAAPDFSQDTLPLVDHWITLAEVKGGALLELLVPMAGAYFGEVCRRELSGFRWHMPEETCDWRLELTPRFLYFNPAGAALEAFTSEDQAAWHGHLHTLPEDQAGMKALLDRAGGVREEDYHRLSIRYEVIESVHATLLAAANEGADEAHYGPEVYAAMVASERSAD